MDWNFPVLVRDVVMMGRYGHMNALRMAAREDRMSVDRALERVGMGAYRTRQIGGHLMLVSTHNLTSVPEFCDQCVLVNKTVLAAGPVAEVFTQANLERAFGGVLRHLNLRDALPERAAA